ncbi:Transmembrane transcriptional regulator (anti-sigma factor RsiW) [Pseudoxanthomonas sp. GM95]|uniref:anti-sigma factor family protein n=1 Tax=Pseudoxanthomonas sp. GM95 TaxID=1881043 RepID=UPI0008CF2F89|nr:hypothetical protein [Pseudoxanthomonas sp. GM95]SEK60934.1 Transmembrane transcriptional regulator (anti-sigma factor RsiW) [Pseudoxanthomonas sp. GM95]
MNIDDATLMAYLDGELDAEGVAQVDAALANDPELAARIARQQRLDARLRGAHAKAAEEAVPDALMQLVLGTGAAASANESIAEASAPVAEPQANVVSNVVALPPHKRARTVVTHLSALAAGIVLAVLTLPWLRGGAGGADWEQGANGLQARGALAAALDGQLAADPAGKVQVALSFRDQAGQYCRAFRLASAKTAGLACHDAQGWSLPVLAHDGESAQGELRQAASPLPAAVLEAVDARIAGDTLDAGGEQAARTAGWR